MMSVNIQVDIDSADIVERLVGITPMHLQNFVQRGSYGLRSSVQSGKVREKRRLFSRDDVFGIALVWLLFESGLRGDPIARVLNDITATKTANANLAAKKLLESQAHYLLIVRSPRGPSKTIAEMPSQRVHPVKKTQLGRAMAQHPESDVVVIPVGYKFEDIRKRMEILF